ncbi:MAG: tape measure protein [Anaerorhabdus sp.]|uniref:tape measure protein n=1 Tax=Anaerorhabdus sp. TaxID=1872524 RepID=UPI002FC7C39C
MSRPVDERIVRMTLDNNDFQSKVTKTIGIFGKLINSMKKTNDVDLGKTTKDISGINNAVDKTNMNKLVEGVTNVSSKFSALGAVAFSVLQNITNRAVDAGINLVKSMSLKPVTDGFNEYELKMKSIQTIMSNTQGKSSLQDVSASLGELNTYADKTIYNFGEMTRNIGTFTAAGVSLEDSTTAIKGIANLAAASGSNSEQASTAMYQLSQALSTGSVKLQDWNSVVNAGMGGKLFQEALIKTADNMGIANSASTNFRDSLQEGWLSSEVLLKTLNEFSTNDSMLEAATKVRTFTQLMDTAGEAIGSGWATTWELIFGDFEQAGAMWTAANDAISVPIQQGADARNKMIGDLVNLGARASLVNTVSNAFKGLTKIINIVSSAFKEVFPPASAETLMKLIKNIEIFSAKLILTDETAGKVKEVFKGLFSIFSIGWTTLKLVGEAFKSLIPAGLGGSFLDLLVRVSQLIQGFDKSIKSTDKTKNVFVDFGKTVDKVFDNILKFTSSVGSVMNVVGQGIKKIWTAISPFFSKIAKGIGELLGSFNTQDLLNGGLMLALALAAKKVKGIAGSLEGFIDKIIDSVGGFEEAFGVFGKLGDSLSALTLSVKVGTLVKIATAVGILALSIKLLSNIPAKQLSKSLLAITAVLVLLSKSLISIGKSGVGLKTAISASIMLPALATAVLLMAGAMKVIASIEPDELGRGIMGLASIVGILVAALVVMGKNTGKMAASSLQLLSLATTVVILAQAIKTLSAIKSSSLAKAVGSLGIILLELAVFLKVANGSKLNVATGLALLAIAGAIQIMVNAIEKIAAINSKQLIKGMGTIGIILAEIAIFVKVTNGAKTVGAAVSMAIIAGAIQMLVGPITALGNLSVKQIVKGLGAMGIALAEIGIAMKLASGGVLGAASIVLVAGAINMLVPPLQALGNMSVKQLAKGLGTLAGALTLIAIAANLIGLPGAAALAALALAVASLGVAALGIGIGISAFSTALTVLANMTASNVETIMKALGGILDGLIKLVPKTILLITTVIVEMAKAIIVLAPTLAIAAFELITQLLDVFIKYIPELSQKGTDMIIALIVAFTTDIPRLVEAGVNAMVELITKMAQGIRDHQQEIVDAVLDITEAILEIIITALVGVIDVLFGWIPGVSEKTKEIGDGAKNALRDAFNIEQVADEKTGQFVSTIDGKKALSGTAGANLGIAAKNGAAGVDLKPTGGALGDALNGGINGVVRNANAAGNNLGQSAKQGAGAVEVKSTGNAFGSNFTGGIEDKKGSAKTSGEGLANFGKTGLESVSADSSGKNFGEGFAGGIDSKQDRVNKASTSLGSLAKSALEGFLKIFSPSRVMREDGGHFGEGFALGIEDKESRVEGKATQLAKGAVKAVQGFSGAFSDAMDDNFNLSPVITPVLDMSNISNIRTPNQLNFGSLGSDGVQGIGSTNYYEFNISSPGQDPKAIAAEVEKIIVRRIQS